MFNLGKIEKLASELEEKLGLNDAGDELIDKAEAVVSDGESENLGDKIDEQIEEEKKQEEVPVSALEAKDETEAKEIVADGEGCEEGECDTEGAKACIASMQKLLKIAKAVKMSKDMPACKKQEVLSKIQKASEKFRNAAKADDAEEGDDQKVYNNQNMKKRNTKVNSITLRRGITPKSVGRLLRNPSATMKRIFDKVGDKMDISIPVSRMTASMFVNLLSALEQALDEMD